MLSDLANSISAQIKDDLKYATAIAIAMDCWTSRSYSSSHVAIPAAFFSRLNNSPVHVLVLKISHLHSGEVLAKVLNDCMESWAIDQQVLMITTDNAINMIKAVKLLGEMNEKDGESN